jgi:LysM repeat protein
MRYIAQAGDSLGDVGARFKAPLSTLLIYNPDVLDITSLIPGQVLYIPVLVREPPVGCTEYVAQPGDTLSTVAYRFGIGLGTLQALNPVADGLLFPGTVLNLPRLAAAWEGCCVAPLRPSPWSDGATGRVAVDHSGHRAILTATCLPDPRVFGGECTGYHGWLVDRSEHRLVAIAMHQDDLSGAWCGHAMIPSLGPSGFDEAAVSPEQDNSRRPTGPVVLQGDIRGCFPE